MEESTGSNEVPAGSTNKRKGPTSNFLRFRNRFQNKNLKSGPQHRIVSMPILTADQLSASSVNNQPLSRTTVNKTTIPYAGWQLYFPDIGEVINILLFFFIIKSNTITLSYVFRLPRRFAVD